MRDRVLGLDAWKRGWVCAVLEGGRLVRIHTSPSVNEALSSHPGFARCAIDIPIGLPSKGRRQADCDAKTFLKSRIPRCGLSGSVFYAPPQWVAAAHQEGTSYTEVNESFSTKEKISLQTWGLLQKIAEVSSLTSTELARVREAHPEVSFAAMAPSGSRLRRKKTWDGMHQRRELLACQGLFVPRNHEADNCPADDVLDAVACAWSARRIAEGSACRLGSEGEGQIWY